MSCSSCPSCGRPLEERPGARTEERLVGRKVLIGASGRPTSYVPIYMPSAGYVAMMAQHEDRDTDILVKPGLVAVTETRVEASDPERHQLAGRTSAGVRGLVCVERVERAPDLYRDLLARVPPLDERDSARFPWLFETLMFAPTSAWVRAEYDENGQPIKPALPAAEEP